MHNDFDYCLGTDGTSKEIYNLINKEKIIKEHITKTNNTWNGLSTAYNTPGHFCNGSGVNRKMSWKARLIEALAYGSVSFLGINCLTVKPSIPPLSPTFMSHQGIPPQDVKSSYESLYRLQESVKTFINKIRDPLHFPTAAGAWFNTIDPLNAHYPPIQTQLYALVMLENAANDENLSREQIYKRENTPDNNLAFVIDKLLLAIDHNDYNTAILKTISNILIQNAGGVMDPDMSGARKVKIINSWIERQIFGDDLYHYLRQLVIDNRDYRHDLVPRLIQQVHHRLDHRLSRIPTEYSAAARQYIIENIVSSEFPAISREFHQSRHDPFQWGLCHVGYYFLHKMSLNIQ